MSASLDLDRLLGDLERSCASQNNLNGRSSYERTIFHSHASNGNVKGEDEIENMLDNLSQIHQGEGGQGRTLTSSSKTKKMMTTTTYNVNSLQLSDDYADNSDSFVLRSSVSPINAKQYTQGDKLLERQHKEVIRGMNTIKAQYSSKQGGTNTLRERGGIDGRPKEYSGHGVWRQQDEEERQVSEERNIVKSVSPSPLKEQNRANMELDQVLNSLKTMKLKMPTDDKEPVIPSLDGLLDDLKEDMIKEGINLTPRGICFACKKVINGNITTAMGNTFHPEHLTCTHCNQELGSGCFFEMQGKAYCETDYHSLFSPLCAACECPILDKCVTAFGKSWHPQHFVCASCEHPFGTGEYHENEGRPYCNKCFFDLFAPKCCGCEQPITEHFVWCMNKRLHSDCFTCCECGEPFREGNFFEHDGHPYCERHFHRLRGSLCSACNKAISGRCITAMSRKFHPEHFVCSFCLKQLNTGTFKETNDKAYCHDCFDRLFG